MSNEIRRKASLTPLISILFVVAIMVGICGVKYAIDRNSAQLSGTWICDVEATIENMNREAMLSRIHPWSSGELSEEEKAKRRGMLDGYTMNIDMAGKSIAIAAKGFSNGFHFKQSGGEHGAIVLLPDDGNDSLYLKIREDGSLIVWTTTLTQAIILKKS